MMAAIAVSTVAGTLARLYFLRVDYRQYPSYPQGYTIHLALGFIAAFLGSIAVPALLVQDFAAASFLALAATQFREVRRIERESLMAMETTELVSRGTAYIEGIARVFEARNYLAMFTGFLGSLFALSFGRSPAASIAFGVAGAMLAIVLVRPAMTGQRIGDIATVRVAPIEFDGPLLSVGGVRIMNVGLPQDRERYRQSGLGAMIRPKDANAKATLANLGQRHAIAHDVATLLGVQKDVDEPQFTPIVRRDSRTGVVVLVIVPFEQDEAALLAAIRRVPVLEAAVRKPLSSLAGRMVD